MEFKMGDASEELLRVATDGKIHSAGQVFAGWDGYVRYVRSLEAAVEVAKELDRRGMIMHWPGVMGSNDTRTPYLDWLYALADLEDKAEV